MQPPESKKYDCKLLLRLSFLWVFFAFSVACITFITKPLHVEFTPQSWSLTWFAGVMSPLWTFLLLFAVIWFLRWWSGVVDKVCWDGGMFIVFGWLQVPFALLVAIATFTTAPASDPMVLRLLWTGTWLLAILSPYVAILAFSSIASFLFRLNQGGS